MHTFLLVASHGEGLPAAVVMATGGRSSGHPRAQVKGHLDLAL